MFLHDKSDDVAAAGTTVDGQHERQTHAVKRTAHDYVHDFVACIVGIYYAVHKVRNVGDTKHDKHCRHKRNVQQCAKRKALAKAYEAVNNDGNVDCKHPHACRKVPQRRIHIVCKQYVQYAGYARRAADDNVTWNKKQFQTDCGTKCRKQNDDNVFDFEFGIAHFVL